MASGDIDDRLGSAEQLERLCVRYPDFDQYLSIWSIVPIRTFFVPFGAGISADGQRVYISYDLQTVVDGVECESALVRHETTEWGLRRYCDIGTDYSSDPRGHWLANRAEHDRVVQLLSRPSGWELYCEIIDPQVILDERLDFEDKPIPFDISFYPYPESIRMKLREAMLNARSEEEWSK